MTGIIVGDVEYSTVDTSIRCIPARLNINEDAPICFVRMFLDRENDFIAPCHNWEEIEEMMQKLLRKLKPVILERLEIEKGADE